MDSAHLSHAALSFGGSPLASGDGPSPLVADDAGAPRHVAPSAEQIINTLTAICLAADRTEAAKSIVQRLERLCGERAVSWGWGGHRLQCLFDSRRGQIGEESPLFAELEEAWDQYAEPSGSMATAARQMFFFYQNDGSGRGVLVVDGARDEFDASRLLEPALPPLAAAFWSRPKRESWFKRRGLSVRTRHVVYAVVLLLGVLLVPCRYRIACTSQVEPVVERVVAAPFEATLEECLVVPGDMVAAGQPLLRLDGRPLRLERESIESEIEQAEKNHAIALASGRVAEAQLALLERKRLRRRWELLDNRLQQLTLTSPIAGVVVSGDHRRTIGSPVLTGQSLLEVAPLEEMEVEVEIPEFEIRYATVGQPLEVTMQAFRETTLSGRLAMIYPSSEVRDGQNVFVGVMRIDNREGHLRPGMRGSATLYGPTRPWGWSWLRPALETARQLVGW